MLGDIRHDNELQAALDSLGDLRKPKKGAGYFSLESPSGRPYSSDDEEIPDDMPDDLTLWMRAQGATSEL